MTTRNARRKPRPLAGSKQRPAPAPVPALSRSYFLATYGCTLNQADSELATAVLTNAGWKKAVREETASVLVLNSCGVKSSTSNKILERLRHVNKPVVLMGCLSADGPAVLHANPAAVLVGTSALACLPQALEAALGKRRVSFFANEDKSQLSAKHSGLIAKIPIAEGCTGSCAFCFTKLARGHLHSYPPKYIVREIERAVEIGAREIQLTAQDTGAYGVDIGKGTNLSLLLDSITKIPGNFRVRIGMINPQHAKPMLPEILKALESGKFYKFLHVPVQAGSDKVLREMRRGHTAKDFELVAAGLRKQFPDCVLSTDIIVGYPGETEKEFLETLDLLRRVRPDVVNVSKFTPRPRTLAALLKQVPNQEIKRRSTVCAELVRAIAKENNERFIGRTFSVLITEKQKTLTGRDENYRQVALGKKEKKKIGDTERVDIVGATVSCLLAE